MLAGVGVLFTGVAGCFAFQMTQYGDKRCVDAPRIRVGDSVTRVPIAAGAGGAADGGYTQRDDNRIVQIRIVQGRVASIHVEPAHVLDP